MNYIIGLLVITLGIWAFELIFIVFAILFKNKGFIRGLTAISTLIAGIYGIVLSIGAFIWLLNATNLFVAIILSVFFGGIIFGIASIPATLANLPFVILSAWAEEKIED